MRDGRRLAYAGGKPISRRDFINGIAIGAAGIATTASVPAYASSGVEVASDPYPPLRTGLRGSHPGSFEQAHILRDGGHPGVGAPTDTGEHYDLIVVGGGISGLAAAHLFRSAKPAARILILENHDDFGGHAKRNEFHPGRATLIGNGGTLGIDSPRPYSAEADGLLKQIGIDVPGMQRIETKHYYSSRGLGRGIFFDKATFGADHLAVGAGDRPWSDVLAAAPLSSAARRDIAAIEGGGADYLPGLSSAEKKSGCRR